MRIKKIKIDNFGKIRNKEIEFCNGINLIEGENEAGKSTIEGFITATLFNFHKYKKNKITEYEIYKPWHGKDFSGELEYELKNKDTYIVKRDFDQKFPDIYSSDGFNINKKFEKNKGEIFFLKDQIGLEKSDFEKTALGKQNLIVLDEESKQEMISKIINLSETGDESISLTNIIKNINKKIRDDIGSNSTKDKPLNIVDKKIEKLLYERKKMQDLSTSKEKNALEREKAQKVFNDSDLKLKLIERIKEEKKEYKFEEKLISELKINIEKKEREIAEKNTELGKHVLDVDSNEDKIAYNEEENRVEKFPIKDDNQFKQKRIFKYFQVSLIFLNIFIIIVGLLGYFSNSSTIVKLVNNFGSKRNYALICVFSYIIASIFLILSLYFTNNKNNNVNYLEKDEKGNNENNVNNNVDVIKTIDPNILLMSEIKVLEREILNQKEILKNKVANFIDRKKNFTNIVINEFGEKVDFKYIAGILEMSAEKIIAEEGALKQKRESAIYLLSKSDVEKVNIEIHENSLMEVEEGLEKLYEEKKNLLEIKESLNLAKDLLEESYIDLKKLVNPKFIKEMTEFIKYITKNKYEEILIGEDSEIYIKDKNLNQFVNIRRLSKGTIEQINLAFRLAILKNISNEPIPIILDEAFSNYDDKRMENILNLLMDKFAQNQIIIFTCTKREKEILEKNKIPFKNILI